MKIPLDLGLFHRSNAIRRSHTDVLLAHAVLLVRSAAVIDILANAFDEQTFANRFVSIYARTDDTGSAHRERFVEDGRILHIPPTMTRVADNFMYGCSNISVIDLTPLHNVKTIGDYFLRSCTGLTHIDLSPLRNVTHIGDGFLRRCSGLTHIDMTSVNQALSQTRCPLIGCTGLRDTRRLIRASRR